MAHLSRILIALDQLVNTIIGGWPDESIFLPLLATKG